MKKTIIAVLVVLTVIGVIAVVSRKPTPNEKIYAAVEGEGKISVVDAEKRTVIKTIDLSVTHDGGMLTFAPHNIQVAPDGKTVWVTANAGMHQGHGSLIINRARANGGESAEPDQVIVIDPGTDFIIKRLELSPGLHLAHVALTPDSAIAYVTAQAEGTIYKIDAKTFEILKKIEAPKDSEPHGLRIDPKGQTAYIALLKGRGIGFLDTVFDTLSIGNLKGQAVQVGVTPNGAFTFASLYDTKELALFSVESKLVKYIKLPESAKGPIQMYPTPDSKFVYLADQGYYFGEPAGSLVYKIDLDAVSVVKEIKAGNAPHGVVVSKDGKFVYVTNLLSGDLSVIDTSSDTEIAKIPLGKEPNGVSIWSKTAGGTP